MPTPFAQSTFRCLTFTATANPPNEFVLRKASAWNKQVARGSPLRLGLPLSPLLRRREREKTLHRNRSLRFVVYPADCSLFDMRASFVLRLSSFVIGFVIRHWSRICILYTRRRFPEAAATRIWQSKSSRWRSRRSR